MLIIILLSSSIQNYLNLLEISNLANASKIINNNNSNYTENVTLKRESNCLFLHGSRGQEAKKPGAISNHLVTYSKIQQINPHLWGDMKLYTNCRKVYYNLSDTLHKSWDNPILSRTYYNFSNGCSQVDQNGKCTQWLSIIDRPNKVFTHSMGTLILASFCHSHPQECQIFKNSKKKVSWYSVQPPLTGTPIANQVDTWCRQKNGINAFLTKYYEACEDLDGKLRTTVNNLSLKPSYRNLASGELAKITYNYISGGICGISAWGSGWMTLFKSFDEGMWGIKLNYLWIASVVESARKNPKSINLLKKENDGFVPADSCLWKRRNKFISSYKASFYLAKSNHIEGTASTPDSLLCSLGISQERCVRLWYKQRTLSP